MQRTLGIPRNSEEPSRSGIINTITECSFNHVLRYRVMNTKYGHEGSYHNVLNKLSSVICSL